MLQNLAVMRGWPLWTRLAVAGIALTLACLFQIPLETEIPGEPFLLFFLIVIASTVAFGEGVGFFGVGLSAFLSFLFFEPFGSIALQHAADLIRVEVYALVTSASVLGFSRLGRALIVAHEAAHHFEESDGYKSLLLRELAHRVANNFATVAALIRAKANLVGDAEAKSVLNEAIEQVSVMARVHRRLHVGDKDVALDSESFVRELCADLKASMARGRPVSIECVAIHRPLPLAHAIPLGLIVTELVTTPLSTHFPIAAGAPFASAWKRATEDCVLPSRTMALVSKVMGGPMGAVKVRRFCGHCRSSLAVAWSSNPQIEAACSGSTFRTQWRPIRPRDCASQPH